ncbi:hypothetical protein F4V47_09405 [Lactococcus garvieae subsp. garvieae]|uniref:hypothetical protein n=1 Tax=Lactococcus garvieae TaxID=1363 RepID=UPI0005A7E2CB|nr:hypothetical protein [Lactococcus garvieae]KAA8710672.1 hypothetical protein F4V47_09405 [Lactococcus garvieae subsp. garvieae]MDG6192259.1 hypothetical protein [Lactococcus garvieae]QPR49410.1 hypothetical protein I6G86_02850 [Lactococcus garvieae]
MSKKLFINENLRKEVELSIVDNIVSIICKETNIAGAYIVLSALVGHVNLGQDFQCGKKFKSNELLMSILCLKIFNNIYAEKNIVVEAIFVKSNQIVMYGTPLFLFRYMS